MKLIAGLGNPGKKYRESRHNIGFCVVDHLAREWMVELTRRKHQGRLGSVLRSGEQIVLLKPQTYMNLSGESVSSAMLFYKVSAADLLVIVDDMALPLGQLRLRPKGSAGGHNGLKDIIAKLGHDEFGRLRIGIGPAAAEGATSHVLGDFDEEEKSKIDQAICEGAGAVACWCEKGIDEAMNRFNPGSHKLEDRS